MATPKKKRKQMLNPADDAIRRMKERDTDTEPDRPADATPQLIRLIRWAGRR